MDSLEVALLTGSLMVLSFIIPFVMMFALQWNNMVYMEMQKLEKKLKYKDIKMEPFRTLKKTGDEVKKSMRIFRKSLIAMAILAILSIMCILTVLWNFGNSVLHLFNVQAIEKKELAMWLFTSQVLTLFAVFLIVLAARPIVKLNKLIRFMIYDQELREEMEEEMTESQGKGRRSRKLWMAIIGIALLSLLGVIASPEITKVIAPTISVVIAAYLVSQGYADGQVAKSGK